ncbi:MAG: hypothetical protein ACPGWR_34050, partial [Ardenticatenaceae bacterium]
MAKQQKLFLLIPILIAVIALMVLSSGLSELTFRPGTSLHLWQIFWENMRQGDVAPPPLPSGDGGAMIDLLTPIFWVTVPFVI